VENLMDLVNNKGLLIKDLQAAVSFMRANEHVRPGELGLVGGSMGATMALAGNGNNEVLCSVALSPISDGVFLLFPNMTLSSVYYLVGELDNFEEMKGADFPAETQRLYELTEEPKKMDIIEGTADHGSDLLSRDSLNTSITDWILERVPVK
jgi:dienelactone hydrolase